MAPRMDGRSFLDVSDGFSLSPVLSPVLMGSREPWWTLEKGSLTLLLHVQLGPLFW